MSGIGVIGLGYWGPQLVRNFHAVAGRRLVIACDKDPQRTAAIAAAYPAIRHTTSADEVLSDSSVSGVVIATPVKTHFHLAKAALEAGKSVLVEKPLADTVEHAEQLVELAHRKGLVLMVDHVYLYSPAIVKIRELVERRELGELFYIDSVRINLGLVQRDINVIWDLAPHDLSIVDHLVGRLPKSIAAFGTSHAGHQQEDVAYLNLDFGGGLIANFHVNWLSPVKVRYIMVGGSKKSLIYNDLHPQEPVKVYDSGVVVRDDDLEDRRRVLIDYRTGDVWSPYVPRSEPLSNVATAFLNALDNGTRPLADGESGLRIVRILEAAERSIKAQGGRITL